MIVELREEPGRCRWCGCTDLHACDGGCSWANIKRTLCSECVDVDRLVRSRRGRQQLAQIVNLAPEDLRP